MNFIVKPIKPDTSNRNYVTLCWKCSEDPRACPPAI